MTGQTSDKVECGVIGMLHVPINSLLAAPEAWRNALGLPSMTRDDWSLIGKLPTPNNSSAAPECGCVTASIQAVERLSVWRFLWQRILREASLYDQNGVTSMMLENAPAPYFIRGEQPPVIYWVMRALADRVRAKFPNVRLGLQVLAYSDDWAMDIACRYGLDFIRCESALFEGIRPEGRTLNRGNLARLYMMRNMLMAQSGQEGPIPQVYVDIQKKHTVFTPALETLGLWLDNILFQKLEGIVVTGMATGLPVDEDDLRRARGAIKKAKAESQAAVGVAWASPLIVGSGVSADNVRMCKRYADAVIVGSSLKKNGFWECPVEEERVKRFMEAWRK